MVLFCPFLSFFSSLLAATLKIRHLQEVAAKRRSTGQLFKHLDPFFLHRVPGLGFSFVFGEKEAYFKSTRSGEDVSFLLTSESARYLGAFVPFAPSFPLPSDKGVEMWLGNGPRSPWKCLLLLPQKPC